LTWQRSSSSSWTTLAAARATGEGQDGEVRSFALDPLGQPRIVFDRTDTPVGVGIAGCDTGCEAPGSSWQIVDLESMQRLQDIAPIPITGGCSTSVWMRTQDERVAVGPAGEVRVAYTALHQQGGSCAITTDRERVRVLVP
jgi:hypothetical protein